MVARDPVLNAAKAARMKALIQRYFEACNAADREAIAACLAPDAVHYFPPGMYDGPFRGASVIAEKWCKAVEELGSFWVVERVICDAEADQAAAEWSHYKTMQGQTLRGDEWYVFDADSGLISELRAYYASPQDTTLERNELGGFDYEGRGYSLRPPEGAR